MTFYIPSPGGVATQIRNGLRIRFRHFVFATGYEVCEILPRGIVDLKSTHAVASEPIADPSWWAEHPLIWQTGNPYLYARAISDNRVLIVGRRRDSGVKKKGRTNRVEKQEYHRTLSAALPRGSRSNPHLRGWAVSARQTMAFRKSVSLSVFHEDCSPSGWGAMESRSPKSRLA